MKLKNIAEVSPLIGAFLIFIGYFKLAYYYQHWNINILQYLDFSEIILSFLNDLNILIFFVIMLFLQGALGTGALMTIDHHLKRKDTEDETEKMNKGNDPALENISIFKSKKFPGFMPLLEHIYENKSGIMLTVLIIFSVVFSVAFYFHNSLFLLYLTFIGVVQLVPYFLEKILGITKKRVLIQISFIATCIGFTWAIGFYDIRNTTDTPPQFSIELAAESISTSDSIVFLGKTNNFFFFYNNASNQTLIYPTEGVVKISTTKN